MALALPEVVAVDLAIPAQVFGHRDEQERYSFTLCAAEPGLVASTTGFCVHVNSARRHKPSLTNTGPGLRAAT